MATADPQYDPLYLHSIKDLSMQIFIAMGSAIHLNLPPKQLPLCLKESFYRSVLSNVQKALTYQVTFHCLLLSRRVQEMFCLHSQSLQIT